MDEKQKSRAIEIGQSGAYLVNLNFDEYITRSTALAILCGAEDGREDDYEEAFYDHITFNWHGVFKFSSDLDAISGKEDVTLKMIAECFGRDWQSKFNKEW